MEDRNSNEGKIIQSVAGGGRSLIRDRPVIIDFTMGNCGKPLSFGDGSRKPSRNGSQDIANTNPSTRRFVVFDKCTRLPERYSENVDGLRCAGQP